jgi:hypothetical protein
VTKATETDAASVVFFAYKEWRTGDHGVQGGGRGRTGGGGGSRGHDEGTGGARTWVVPMPVFSGRIAKTVREKFTGSVLAKYTSELEYS